MFIFMLVMVFPNYILENTKLYLLNRKIISNFAFK